jgi:hypothetical protein
MPHFRIRAYAAARATRRSLGCEPTHGRSGVGKKFVLFEKKNQKTFGLLRNGPGERTRQNTKVFCFFSSEKKSFLPHGCVTKNPKAA